MKINHNSIKNIQSIFFIFMIVSCKELCSEIPPPSNEKLTLTPNEVYFDKTGPLYCHEDKTKTKDATQLNRNRYFDYVGGWSREGDSLTWGLVFKNAGSVEVTPIIENFSPHSEIEITIGDQKRKFSLGSGSSVEFAIPAPGRYDIKLKAVKIYNKELGKVKSLLLTGTAVNDAEKLQIRWRPAAVHGSFGNRQKPKKIVLAVMEVEGISKTGMYAPIITPFGYFGTSFTFEPSVKGVNFSLWSKNDSDIKKMSHLLAVGKGLEFSGFGHEGTGVKPRGRNHYEDQNARRAILGLRMEYDYPYETFHGYIFDEESGNWELFGIGRKYKPLIKRRYLKIGAFVEVPGPPHKQRTGHLVREARYNGWLYSEDGKWYPVDTLSHYATANVNKEWSITETGQFSMSMGGFKTSSYKNETLQLSNSLSEDERPDYLKGNKFKQLFKLPAYFGDHMATNVTTDSASIKFLMKGTGSNPKATIYFGEKDCLTFAKRNAHGTEQKNFLQSEGRFWSHSKKIKEFKNNVNIIKLDGLKASTKYFYRILVSNDQGKIWTFKTGTFNTK